MQTNVVCAECGKTESYDMKPGYPRKYCKACSDAKKASYAAKDSQLQVNGIPTPVPNEPKGNGFMDARSASIVAQVCVKGAVELFNQSEMPMHAGVKVCVDSYKKALQELNA